jgi:HEAT repeat protein
MQTSAMQTANGQWLAFTMPVLQGTRSPCCWKGQWGNHGTGNENGMGEVGCSLGKKHQSYGTQSDSALTDNVIVYTRIKNGEAQSMRVVGESCPVDAGGAKVTWIGGVQEDASLDWLESIAESEDSALYALALHRSTDASNRLQTLAMTENGELSEEAVFWLGEARGNAGFEALKQLLDDLPDGKTRRQINFALAQNDSAAAADLLQQISESDRNAKQRSDAMFWLAQEYPQRAKPLLLEVVHSEQDEELLEQAVFAISQLPDDTGSEILLDLARDEKAPRTVRRQALFWLANSDDDKTVAALTELLTR